MRDGRYGPVVPQSLRSLAFATATLVAGCGGSEPAPEPSEITGPPKQRIAATVNTFFEAFSEGNAGVACKLLTERGKKLVVRITPQFQDLSEPISPENCEEAIELGAEATEGKIGQVVSAQQVRLDGSGRASVVSEFRGELAMRRVDGTWLIVVPTFID